jgi:protein involved in temperature-dependent protein secretion
MSQGTLSTALIARQTNEHTLSKRALRTVRLATAYFVTRKNPRFPLYERAKKVNVLKPHVDVHVADETLRWVEEKRREAEQVLLAPATA